MTFREYLQLKGYSRKSIASIQKICSYFQSWCATESISDETEVSHNDIIAYIKTVTDKRISQKTAANYISHIKKYYDYLIKEHGLIDNPCSYIMIKGIKRKTLYDIISYETLEQVCHSYPIEAKNPYQSLIRKRNKVMLGLLIYQGLRSEELMKLELADLQLREGKIMIQGGRRSAGRVMKLESGQVFELMDYVNDTRKALLQQTNKMPKDTTALFITTTKGAAIDSNTMKILLRQIQTLNNKITSLNQVRASVIVHWLRQYNLRKVQHLVGHKHISSTEAYQSSDLEDLKEDISKYHPF
ncbi:tyrosine-type recombinase/integrase [Taibaiella chishuiensis]|uniref:Integrase/recombinase XerD n=1 Tax=Taibaiella chishuiensis TaxID=1434707 RepID=A0A2P8CPK6_9BACT|nr:tyrosine-type recombinase/integrase [Taibaiella chishuiensis]PSK86880.1 integrase/recombinase XerD [Taibaiella chishuiensis]